jgi:membrane associated rhomboid family serine protease
VTWTLVGINVLLYLAVLARPSIAGNLEMIGKASNGQGGVIGVGAGQWYRLITSAFVAPTGGLGITDIAFNMWALIVVGPTLERMLGSACSVRSAAGCSCTTWCPPTRPPSAPPGPSSGSLAPGS